MTAVTPQVNLQYSHSIFLPCTNTSLDIMESNPKGVPRASSAVKDNGQPVIMTTDEEKETAKLPTVYMASKYFKAISFKLTLWSNA